jgi:hypothetical protein
VKTSSLTQSLARCALFYLAGLTPGFAQVPAAEPPRDARLPPQLLANKCYTTPNSSSAKVPVQSLTQIRTNNDIDRLRADLIKQIWPDGYPTGTETVTASSATSGKDDASASGMYAVFSGDRRSNLRSEQRLTIDLGEGFASVVYVWTPRTTNNRLFLVHDGHTDSMVNSTNYATAHALLGLGFTVVWLQMPLYGDNLSASSPAAPFPANCRVDCDRHGAIFAAFGETGSPFRYFLEPVVVSLNYALSQGKYRDVTMMGASGGGWTTLLAAAIDTRITNSASIAGSLPLHLLTGPCGEASIGHAEQRNEPGNLYSRITYPDLYVMAANGTQADGSPRKHLQINNQFDTCCFFGIAHQSYSDALAKYIAERKLGNYSYHLNTTFVGHGYDFRKDPVPVNNTLKDVVLPAIGAPAG